MEAQEVLEELWKWCYLPRFQEQRQWSMEFFYAVCGKINDEDAFYENRMNLFQDLFLFDYRLTHEYSGTTMYELFLKEHEDLYFSSSLSFFEALRSQKRSLFKVVDVENNVCKVRDLFNGLIYSVFELSHYSFATFSKGDIFDGRIFSYLGQYYFTGSFVFHGIAFFSLIEEFMAKIFKHGNRFLPQFKDDWKSEIQKAEGIIELLKENKRQFESQEIRKSFEILSVQSLFQKQAHAYLQPRCVSSIGKNHAPLDIPEVLWLPFFNFLDVLCYCELQCKRYKHVEYAKIYKTHLSKWFNSVAGNEK